LIDLVVNELSRKKMMEYLQFIDSNPIFGPSKVPVGYYEKLDGIYWTIKNLNRKGRTSTSTV
jgi:hypothetical protein